MGKKTFYTESDIQNLAEQGVSSLSINDDIVLTELAWDTARALGIKLVRETAPSTASDDLKAQIKRAVVAKVGNSIDDANLDAIISKVLGQMGN